jgi:excisionase family DNA binding protein
LKPRIKEPNFLTVPDAARLCGVSRNTVYLWVRDERIKAYQTPGRTNLIRPCDLVDFMQTNGMFVPPELATLAKEDQKSDIAHAQTGPGITEPCILVVDDEPAIRTLYMRMLKNLGPLMQAETGYEALHLMALHPNKAQCPAMPVIIVTGYGADIPEAMIQDGSIACVINKPFTAESLREIVARFLPGKPSAP